MPLNASMLGPVHYADSYLVPLFLARTLLMPSAITAIPESRGFLDQSLLRLNTLFSSNVGKELLTLKVWEEDTGM